jgi:nitroreductase
MSISEHRQGDFDVDPAFVSRWSQRAYTAEPIPDPVLFSFLEAARWAPSGGNAQPWRFIYAKREAEHWQDFLALGNERNRRWASNASALVLLLSRKLRSGAGGPQPSRSHSFDAGAAWANLAHQAHLAGWSARAMGGFDRDAARALLSVPMEYKLEVLIAIGKAGQRDNLPDDLRELELPTGRLPLSSLVANGRFLFPHDAVQCVGLPAAGMLASQQR